MKVSTNSNLWWSVSRSWRRFQAWMSLFGCKWNNSLLIKQSSTYLFWEISTYFSHISLPKHDLIYVHCDIHMISKHLKFTNLKQLCVFMKIFVYHFMRVILNLLIRHFPSIIESCEISQTLQIFEFICFLKIFLLSSKSNVFYIKIFL